jgi:regulator of sirC expression with transglutaminase-like and TPR domain
MSLANKEQIFSELKKISSAPDEQINLLKATLYLAGLNHIGLSFDRYLHHFENLTKEIKSYHENLIKNNREDDLVSRIEAFNYILFEKKGYCIEHEKDLLDSYDIIRAVDTRSGAPVLFGILFLDIARQLDWNVNAMSLPDHFLIKMVISNEHGILDPGKEFALLQAQDLREYIKQSLGENAELSSEYYEPLPNRYCLIVLLNMIKNIYIKNEDYNSARNIVLCIRAFAPSEFRSLLDLGVLSFKVGLYEEAITALEAYIEHTPNFNDRYDAELLIQDIKDTIS